MARLIVVEVLDARGAVRSRHRLDALPATVGRAGDNDVVLDDPYVCAHHLRLVADATGQLAAEDAGSVNGIRRPGARLRADRVALGPAAAEVVAGRTLLRVRPADHPVAPALVERGRGAAHLRLESPLATLAVCTAAVAVFSAFGYSRMYERASVARAIGGAAALIILLSVWAGVWSVVGRVVAHQFQFLRHLAIAALAALAFGAVGEGGEWIDFVSPTSGLGTLVGVLGFGGLAVALLYAHLTVASSALGRRQRLSWSAGVAAAAALLVTATSFADRDKFTTRLDDPGSIKPLPPRWVRAEPAASFAEHATALQLKADSLARRHD